MFGWLTFNTIFILVLHMNNVKYENIKYIINWTKKKPCIFREYIPYITLAYVNLEKWTFKKLHKDVCGSRNLKTVQSVVYCRNMKVSRLERHGTVWNNFFSDLNYFIQFEILDFVWSNILTQSDIKRPAVLQSLGNKSS